MSPVVLYEDNHCLAVEKPAGLLTMGDATGDPSLVTWAKAYLAEKYQKPGAVFVGVVHRLDRPVSGVVLLARTSKGAARLSAQFREHTVEKVYRALVPAGLREDEGEFRDYLAKDSTTNVVRTVADAKHGLESLTRYRVLNRQSRWTLVELRPVTGRGHQLRVQLASRGCPILGDQKYGSSVAGGGQIALQAYALTFAHPTRQEPITVAAPFPKSWSQFSEGRELAKLAASHWDQR